jgi:hypothetical protein
MFSPLFQISPPPIPQTPNHSHPQKLYQHRLKSLQQSVSLLKEENDELKSSIHSHLGDKEADELLKKENLANAAAAKSSNPLIATNIKDTETDPNAVKKIRKSIE